MTKEQLGYEAPTTTIFTVQAQRVLCGSGYGEQGAPGSGLDFDNPGYGFGEF